MKIFPKKFGSLAGIAYLCNDQNPKCGKMPQVNDLRLSFQDQQS